LKRLHNRFEITEDELPKEIEKAEKRLARINEHLETMYRKLKEEYEW